MPKQRTRTDVFPCSELMAMKQANTTFAFNRSYPSISASGTIFLFFYAFSSLRAQAFSSRTLPVEEFVRSITAVKETEESKMKFMLLRERSSSKHKFTFVAMTSFFAPKDILLKILFRTFFQMEIFFSIYPSKMKTDTENLNFGYFGAWLFL